MCSPPAAAPAGADAALLQLVGATSDTTLFTVAPNAVHLGVGAPDRTLLALCIAPLRAALLQLLDSDEPDDAEGTPLVTATAEGGATATASRASSSLDALQYGPARGDGRYLRALAAFLTRQRCDGRTLSRCAGAAAVAAVVVAGHRRCCHCDDGSLPSSDHRDRRYHHQDR